MFPKKVQEYLEKIFHSEPKLIALGILLSSFLLVVSAIAGREIFITVAITIVASFVIGIVIYLFSI